MKRWKQMAVCLTLICSWSCEAMSPETSLRARCLSVLYSALASGEFWPSMHAAEGLTQAGHGEEVLRLLAGRLDGERDDQHRCGLAREQVRAGKRELVSVMFDILANPDSQGRTHACESLYKVRGIGDGKLLRAAMEEGDPVRELMAAAALCRGGDRSLLDRIRAYLTSDNERARQVAVWILGRLGDPTDWPALRKLAATESKPLMRAYAVNALAQLAAPGALQQVLVNLRSPDPAVRTYSAQTVGDCHALLHRAALLPLLNDEHLDARVRAAQSLLRLTGPDTWWPLFDGRTLTGWRQLNGSAKYRVEDGCIVGTTVKGSPNSFLCTRRLYSDFILELEVKVDPRLNSGIQIRSNSFPDYMNGRVHGYQVEIAANGNSGFIYDEARRRKFLDSNMKSPVKRAAFRKEGWNKYRIVCVGDHLQTWVNSEPISDLRDDMTAIGFIGLQVHSFKGSSPAEVRWRNLRIQPLGAVVGKWWEP